MKDMWEKINDNIKIYLKEIIDKYNMKVAKINNLATALISKNFALVITLDRFDANVSYVLRAKNNELVILLCDNYFAERYDKDDRKNLIAGDGAEIYIKNSLSVINNGLINKWSDVLEGKYDWIDKFKKSRWYAVKRPNDIEREIISKYI